MREDEALSCAVQTNAIGPFRKKLLDAKNAHLKLPEEWQKRASDRYTDHPKRTCCCDVSSSLLNYDTLCDAFSFCAAMKASTDAYSRLLAGRMALGKGSQLNGLGVLYLSGADSHIFVFVLLRFTLAPRKKNALEM